MRVPIAAAAVIATLPPLGCVRGLGGCVCAAPYDPPVISLSVLVAKPPLFFVFFAAGAAWTLHSAARLRRRNRPRAAALALVCGLAFCCLPTGAAEWRWIAHGVALASLCCVVAAGEWPVPATRKPDAYAHLACTSVSVALAAAFMLAGYTSPDWAPPPVRALSVAAAETAAVLHAAAYQAAVEEWEENELALGSISRFW